MRISSFVSASAVCLAIGAVASTARADVTAAAKAFSEGQSAQLAGDYRDAARKFELAHSIMPSAGALRSAARMRLEAGDDALAATHAAELAEQYPDDVQSMQLSEELLEQLGPKLIRIEARCETPCSLSSDRGAIEVEKRERHLFYVAPGSLVVDAWFENGEKSTREVAADGGDQLQLDFALPEAVDEVTEAALAHRGTQQEPNVESTVATGDAGDESMDAPRRGLPRGWFYAGTGVTLAAAGATTWFGLQTRSLRHDFDDSPTLETYDDGRQQQLYTNVALATAGVFAVTTVVLAIVTDWKGQRSERGVSLTPQGLEGRF